MRRAFLVEFVIAVCNSAFIGLTGLVMLNEITAPFAQALAARLARPLVFYDLEHTGGKADERGVTEFASVIVTPSKIEIGVNTLVDPGQDVPFNPFVTKITGITRKMVAGKPVWPTACAAFVLEHEESVWCGFNSRSCDSKMILSEHRRFGLRAPGFRHQLDVMRLARLLGERGSLSQLVAAHAPHAATIAHRALGDALMTLALLEALSPHVDEAFLENEGLGSPAPYTPTATPLKTILPVPAEAPTRRGQRWTPEESESVRAAFMAQTPIEVIAARYQRTPFAIAIHLVRYGLLREEEALVYKAGMETDKSSVDAHEKEPLVAPPPHKRQRKGEKWSCSEENLVLHRWRKEGKTLESIATEHGRTLAGISAKLRRLLGIGRKDLRAENTRRKRAMIPSETYLR